MTDPLRRIPFDAEPFATAVDQLIDIACDQGLDIADIAVVLEDRAASARRKADEE